MNLIQQLIADSGNDRAVIFIGIKTTSGDIRVGAVQRVSDELLVLEPSNEPSDDDSEVDLGVTTYFNINNIVFAWLHV